MDPSNQSAILSQLHSKSATYGRKGQLLMVEEGHHWCGWVYPCPRHTSLRLVTRGCNLCHPVWCQSGQLLSRWLEWTSELYSKLLSSLPLVQTVQMARLKIHLSAHPSEDLYLPCEKSLGSVFKKFGWPEGRGSNSALIPCWFEEKSYIFILYQLIRVQVYIYRQKKRLYMDYMDYGYNCWGIAVTDCRDWFFSFNGSENSSCQQGWPIPNQSCCYPYFHHE